jgi:salicylate hydroxylase
VGAGINLGPNTTRLLFGWGLSSEIGRLGTQPECFWYRKSTTGEPIGYQLWGKTLERETGAPLVQFHRADLHNMLFGLLKDSSSVQIRLGSKVLSVDPDAPSATLVSGEIIHGDVIIAADGGRSRIRDLVIGQPTPVYPTGQAAFRGERVVQIINSKN